MDAKRVGCFIAELRKEKGITQKELAEHLHVSDKTISRWETGKGYPEVSIMKLISEYFEITVTELLSGTRLTSEEYQECSDDMLVHSLKKSKKRNIAEYILYTIIGLFLIIYMGLMTGEYNASLEVLVVFISIIVCVDQIKKKPYKIVCIISIFIIFVIIGGMTIREEQYLKGKNLGYQLGNKIGNIENYNFTVVVYEYADEICPYKFGTNEWKGFMMGFQSGYEDAKR